MRGSISWQEAMNMTSKERKIIAKVAKDGMEQLVKMRVI
jgi:hypothetical protein